MRLILTLTGGGAVPDKDKMKALTTGSISIGRAPGNDWVLPDPDRSLSKTHCTITERNGRFILVDSSTNGIFINGSPQATERDSQTVLNQGDRLTLGDYTISVTAIGDGSAAAPDADMAMDYRHVVPNGPSYSGMGGPVMPTGPLDVDPLDDPFGRQASPGFQHPMAPVAVQPRGLDPFDQVQSQAGFTGGIGPDDDMFRGVQQSTEWQGASRPDNTPVISQAVPAMRIASAPPSGDIDFDALIGDLPGSQGGFQSAFRAAPRGTDPFGGGVGQGAMPQHDPLSATPGGQFGGGMQMPGFPPGAGFQHAGPPPGFNAAELMADLAQPHQAHPAQPHQADPAQPHQAHPAQPHQADPFASSTPAASPPAAFAEPQPAATPPRSLQPAPPQPDPLQQAPVQQAPGHYTPGQQAFGQHTGLQPPPFAPAGSAPMAPAVMPELRMTPPIEAPPAFEPRAFQAPLTEPPAEPPAAAFNPFDETGNARHMADEAKTDPMAVTTRQAPAAAPAAAPVAAPVALPVAPPAAPAQASPVAAPPTTVPQQGGADARAALQAFLEGAGAAGSQIIDVSNPEAALRAAGEVFRAMTEGLREVLISRAAIKSEMRIEQTMIAAQGNNALKFSVTPEDAVAAMLAPKRRGYMPPLAAAREAVDDIKQHEIAVMAGVQTALMTLLRRFDPDELEKRLSIGGLSAVLPGARKSRYWDSFRQIYGDITREAEDDFQAVFGRQFAKAYTEQTRKE